MCLGESSGRSAGQGGPEDLAAAILARIVGGDLPAGAELDPTRLAHLFDASCPDILKALHLLAAQGTVGPTGSGWRVAPGRKGQGRDLLHWAVPLLRSTVALAVERITPAGAAGVLASYDRYAGLAGNGSVATRAAGYRQLMQGLADATGSRFHVGSMSGLLDQTEPFLSRMIANQLAVRRPAEPDDDLGRLAQSMMQGNAAAAQAALEDHLILLGRYFDCPAPSGP